eukprot:6491023-Amphidinium_carterae.1
MKHNTHSGADGRRPNTICAHVSGTTLAHASPVYDTLLDAIWECQLANVIRSVESLTNCRHL